MTFIFICGHHRSGTSILNRTLRQHPLISGFENTGAFEDEGQHLQTVFKPASKFGGPGRYIFDSNSHMNEDHPLVNTKSKEQLLSEWGRYIDLNSKFCLEKSPPNIVRTRFFQSLFPGESVFIVIFRHPLAVAFATNKHLHNSFDIHNPKVDPLPRLLKHTLLGYKILNNDLKYIQKYHTLRLEDFSANPQYESSKIYQFLDIEPTHSNLNIRNNVNQKYSSYWNELCQDKSSSELIQKLRLRFEDSLNNLGYSFDDF